MPKYAATLRTSPLEIGAPSPNAMHRKAMPSPAGTRAVERPPIPDTSYSKTSHEGYPHIRQTSSPIRLNREVGSYALWRAARGWVLERGPYAGQPEAGGAHQSAFGGR